MPNFETVTRLRLNDVLHFGPRRLVLATALPLGRGRLVLKCQLSSAAPMTHHHGLKATTFALHGMYSYTNS